MTTFTLKSRISAASAVCSVFGPPLADDSTAASLAIPIVRLEVCEDVSFGAKWLGLGEIQLFPARPTGTFNIQELVQQAVINGFFEWRLPNHDEVLAEAVGIIQSAKNAEGEPKAAELDHVRRGLEAVPRVAVRCGLAWPLIDPECIARMPWRRPATVVADSTSVYQGCLDFIACHLSPKARFKIPSVVQMELQTHVNNYFDIRRRSPRKASFRAFSERVLGPGGQWVLLRLALSPDVAFERPRSAIDPLRGIVSLEVDQEDKNYGLQKLNRSYADRLILETALYHREHLPQDHPIFVPSMRPSGQVS